MIWCDESGVDLKERDPHGVNSYIRVKFNDVIAEPNESRSCDFVWDASSCCYECWFMLCYQIPAVLCGMCLAMQWAWEFGQIAFWHVWCCSPLMHAFSYVLYPLKCCYGRCLRCFVDPWFESCSYLFGAFEDPKRGDEDPFKTRLF